MQNDIIPEPVVMVNAAASIVDGDEGLSKTMVPVLPAGVMIQVTDAPKLFGTDADTPDHLLHDLRLDLMLFAHEFNTHASIGEMISLVKSYAYWPNMERQCTDHIKYCIYCLTDATAKREVGLSIRTARRFALLLIDAWTLPPSVARKTGCAAVLTMYDKAGGLTIYAVLEDMTAACAATALHVHWFCHYSWPVKMISDNAPEYAGKVMAAVCHIYGIDKTFVAVGDSRAMGGCETARHTIADIVE